MLSKLPIRVFKISLEILFDQRDFAFGYVLELCVVYISSESDKGGSVEEVVFPRMTLSFACHG